jgi:hypothetical protein
MAVTHSIILRGETKTRRLVEAEHQRASIHAELIEPTPPE